MADEPQVIDPDDPKWTPEERVQWYVTIFRVPEAEARLLIAVRDGRVTGDMLVERQKE